MPIKGKQAHPYVLAETFQVRLEEGFTRAARPYMSYKVTTLCLLSWRRRRTDVPGAGQDKHPGRLRASRHGSQQPAVLLFFPGGDLVWIRPSLPLIQFTTLLGRDWGDPPTQSRVRPGTMVGSGTHKGSSRHMHKSARASHLNEVGSSGCSVWRSGP